MEKIFFNLNVIDDYPPVSVESVWSEKLDGNIFKIKNIPFYTKEASLDDDVSVDRGVDGEWVFKGVVTASDNSTLRIVFFEVGEREVEKILEELVNVGCAWEGMGARFYSVNIPGKVNLDDVLLLLDGHAENGWLDYEYGMIRQ